ncbi:chemotaxis protein CheR [Roseomonas stagni]|uniref:Chemotaxis protein methyltransferase n=1 Tax=Falsiroseomonas algicola TaxID=2716930 RepID=A0A6M1LL48_9PROT|nr:CheR family methyltransferase [Falsiroseomonas algicola]NGM20719.1 chemotaxis protein CheR [Falsiroseomonas algicola]
MTDTLSDRRFRQVAGLIERDTGIRLPPVKRTMVEGRLRKRARSLGMMDVDAYCVALFDEGLLETEYQHVIDMVTTNKTDFFREAEHFDFLAREAVPQLLAERGRSARPLKLWSAAASTGAEAYTIAMVLAEMARAGQLAPGFRILGTDISSQVLDVARRAVYPLEMLAPVPKALQQRYVMRHRDPQRRDARIVPELRAACSFQLLNLMDEGYSVDSDIDVVFCRNVLIYFDRPTQEAVLRRLCAHLRPGGFLIVGHSETAAGATLRGMRGVMSTIWQKG